MSGRTERVFLVRMWLEDDRAERPHWRGSIHDVGTGRKRYVTEPSEVADFIAVGLTERLEPGDAPPD